MNDILKIIITIVLFIPALSLSTLIWVLGGWTKGWDYMPNPVNALIDWLME